jgi:hypothetical protein
MPIAFLTRSGFGEYVESPGDEMEGDPATPRVDRNAFRSWSFIGTSARPAPPPFTVYILSADRSRSADD